jgi:hypothetical protein
LLMGLAILLFSLVLVFAGLAFAFLDFAHTLNSFGGGSSLIVWVAVVVGIVGLAVAYVGVSGND